MSPKPVRKRLKEFYRRYLRRAPVWLKDRLGALWRFLRDVGERHVKTHNGALTAAGIAFYLGITLVPLMLLGTSAVGFILGGSERAVGAVTDAVVQLIPHGEELIRGLLERTIANRTEVGIIGLVALLWISSGLTSALRRGIDNIWGGVARKRHWWEGPLIALAMLLGMLVFFLGGTWLTGLFAHVATTDWTLWGMELHTVKGLARLVMVLAPFLLTLLFFFLVYRLVPTTRVRSRSAFVGAVTAAVGFETAKLLFSFYIADISRPTLYYGVLAGLVVIFLWAYYAAHIILVGAEVARRLNEGPGQEKKGLESPDASRAKP